MSTMSTKPAKSTKKTLSKADLLKGKLIEVEISDSECVFLGPLKTDTARNLLRVITSRSSDKTEDNVDLIFTDEMAEAIAESTVDESGQKLLTKDEVLSLPLEHYTPIAKALIDRMNNSTSGKEPTSEESANENSGGNIVPLVVEQPKTPETLDTTEIHSTLSEMTTNSDSPIA